MYQSDIKSESFTWIGDSWADSRSKRRAKLHYQSFKKDSLTVSIQDHVLIRNEESLQPENIAFCFIGKVLDMYEKVGEADPYCCKVQWYVRLTEVPPHLQQQIQDGDYYQEVILDSRDSWNPEVDAETIFKKCCVLKFAKDVPTDTVPEHIDNVPVFFCRYTFDGKKLDEVSPLKPAKPSRPYRRPIENLSPELITVNHRKSVGHHQTRSSSKKLEVNDGKTFTTEEKFEDRKKNGQDLTQVHKEKAEKTDTKSECKALREEDVMGLLNTPSKTVLQATPVKTFYSSEKKQVNLRNADVRTVRKVLPFDSPAKDKKKVEFNNQEDDKTKVSLVKSLSSKTTENRRSLRKSAKDSFLLNKENEITPFERTRITRSGRKVQLPNYLEYWEGFSVDTADPKKRKESIDDCVSKYSESTDEYSDKEDSDVLGHTRKNISLPGKRSKSKQKSKIKYSESTDEEEDEIMHSVKKSKRSSKQLRQKVKKTPSSLARPRRVKLESPKTPLEEARACLHVSAVPESLPCRQDEFSDIFTFVEGKLLEKRGGCMYISGVPGTGKTATVHEVIRALEESFELGHIPSFSFVEINALRLTNPQQCYVHLLKALKGIDATPKHAVDLLNHHFEEGRKKETMTVVMLDELDMLWTKRQEVLYNMFQWPSFPDSCLIVLAIANTMDLPERLLANKIVSRLGLTRMIFQPYTFKQLQEIIMSRIRGLGAFNPDAVQLVSRKVASVSGDARRALDICRRATELVNMGNEGKSKEGYLVGMKQVDAAIQEMFSSSKISAIRNVSTQEQLFLKAVVADFLSTGLEETTFQSVATQYFTLCRMEGVPVLNNSKLFSICSQLYDTRLLLLENGKADVYQRIKLNINIDDINYALKHNS